MTIASLIVDVADNTVKLTKDVEAIRAELAEIACAPPLGPGDDDPSSVVKTSADASSTPLGPGDDDHRSPVLVTEPATRGPLGPGESDGENPDEGFHILTPGPAGPGDTATGPRHVVRVPKQ